MLQPDNTNGADMSHIPGITVDQLTVAQVYVGQALGAAIQDIMKSRGWDALPQEARTALLRHLAKFAGEVVYRIGGI